MKKYKIAIVVVAFIMMIVIGVLLDGTDLSGSDMEWDSPLVSATNKVGVSEPPIQSPEPSEPPAVSELPVPSKPTRISWDDVDANSFANLDGEKRGWGQGKNVDGENRPVDAVSAQEKYGALDGLFVMEPEKKIYLTLDQGYENGFTAPILDVLKEKDVKATFFVTSDYVLKNPDLISRMLEEGHVLANHSWNHPSMPEISLEEAKREITDLHDYIEENYDGYQMTLFRPPSGQFSEQTLALAQALGYRSALWSYAYYDWDPSDQMDHREALKKITDALHPGAIYLLHAVSETNAAILGDFIDNARAQGYEVVPLV